MKRLRLMFAIALIVVGLLLPTLVVKADTLYQYYNTGDNAITGFYDREWRAQTFTTTFPHNITSVKLKLTKYPINYTIGNLTIGIRATNTTGHPLGADLCNGTLDGSNITINETGDWYEITFSGGYVLATATQYAIVVRAPDSGLFDYGGWRYDNTAPSYTGGNIHDSSDNGTTWTSYPAEDAMFEVWGRGTAVPTVTTNNATYISRTSARLNSYLVDDGSEPCDVRFQYGTTAGGGTLTEAQTAQNSNTDLYTGLWVRAGQTLNITDRNVTNLAFPLKRAGNPEGDVNFTIRYASNDTLINSITWGNASAISDGSMQWLNASFASPVVVNASVRLLVEFYGGNASSYVEYYRQNTDVKAGEYLTHYNGTGWTNYSTIDGAYNYTYGDDYDFNTSWINDTYLTGDSPYVDVTNLTVNTTYYFRVQARNTIGTTNGGELNFTTYPTINEPTNFTAYPSSTTISLTWTKGVGATYTMIRGQAGTYPANYTDGRQVYAGAMATATDTSLTPGTTYYYRSWSYDGAGYSTNYTDILMTTSAYTTVTNDTPTTPTQPSNWWGIPDYTNLENIAGYAFINEVADEYGIPYNTFWMSLIIIGIMCIGLFIYSVQHNATVALGLVCVLIIVASIAGLLPLFMIAVIVIPAAGIMMVKRRV